MPVFSLADDTLQPITWGRIAIAPCIFSISCTFFCQLVPSKKYLLLNFCGCSSLSSTEILLNAYFVSIVSRKSQKTITRQWVHSKLAKCLFHLQITHWMKFLLQSKVLWQIVIVQLAVSSKQFELQIACVMFACFVSHLGKIQLYEMWHFIARHCYRLWSYMNE